MLYEIPYLTIAITLLILSNQHEDGTKLEPKHVVERNNISNTPQ